MSKPYHIYLDLDVLNSDTAPTSRAPVLSFEETRTQPFLEGSASDYFVSIVRFSIQTGTSLPVFIPRIATGATDNPTNDINKTIYKITMTYEGGSRLRREDLQHHLHSLQRHGGPAEAAERQRAGPLRQLLLCQELPGLDFDDEQDAEGDVVVGGAAPC
jgi:hypothetical protein